MATIIVPTDYPSIQEAVNAASPGDSIEVLDGNYSESVNVNKSNLKIYGALSVNMEGLSNLDFAFNIIGDNVTIEGFRIMKYKNGIEMTGNYNRITGCSVVFNDANGIKFYGDSNRIDHCSIGGNQIAGISLGGNNNLIEHNTIDANKLAGITSTTKGGLANTIQHNNLSATIVAITLMNSETKNSTIEFNVIRKVEFGISAFSKNNSINNNNILEADRIGILLGNDNNSAVSNMVANTPICLSVMGYENYIATNNFMYGSTYGIAIQGKRNDIQFNVLLRNAVGIMTLHDENNLANNEYYDNELEDLIQVCA